MQVTVKRRSSVPLVFAALLLAFGIFFLGVVVFRDAPLALLGTRAEGVVEKVTEEAKRSSSSKRTGTVRSSSSGSSPSHRLHLRFALPGGEIARFDTLSTWGHTLKEGDVVPIIYRLGPPLRGEVYSVRQLWLPLATGTVVSALCLLGGWLILRVRRRRTA